MNIEQLHHDKHKLSFEDRDEALNYADFGIPKRHPIKHATFALRALYANRERCHPLSVTLTTSSLEQSEQMLSEEAVRLDKVLNSDIDIADKEIDADPETVAAIRELSDGISQYLGKTAVNSKS